MRIGILLLLSAVSFVVFETCFFNVHLYVCMCICLFQRVHSYTSLCVYTEVVNEHWLRANSLILITFLQNRIFNIFHQAVRRIAKIKYFQYIIGWKICDIWYKEKIFLTMYYCIVYLNLKKYVTAEVTLFLVLYSLIALTICFMTHWLQFHLTVSFTLWNS